MHLKNITEEGFFLKNHLAINQLLCDDINE